MIGKEYKIFCIVRFGTCVPKRKLNYQFETSQKESGNISLRGSTTRINPLPNVNMASCQSTLGQLRLATLRLYSQGEFQLI